MKLGRKVVALATLVRGIHRVRPVSGQSTLELLRSYRRFRWATGASPAEFFTYRLWDKSVPIEKRVMFTTWAQRRPLEAYMNPKAAADLVQSKLNGDRSFREFGMPTPPLLGVWYPNGVPGDHPGALRSREALAAVLDASRGGIVVKGEYGGSGENVRVFPRASGRELVHASGKRWSLDQLIREMAGAQPWLVQQRIVSHPDLADLIGNDDVASLRLVTCLRRDGRVHLLLTMLKMPLTGLGLDNLSAGNVAVAVHPDGTLGRGIAGVHGREVDAHPKTGRPFLGFQVPFWSAAVELIVRNHPRFPELTSLGWDVAITADGPVVIEANAWWGDAVQHPGPRGLLSAEFLEYVEERGASHLLTLDRRRQLVEDHRAASRAAKLTTSP